MTIKQHGGIFGRNPTFNNVTIDGLLTASGATLSGLDIVDGNIVMASGKGIDFSATSGVGTSELFDDYEEGTWTPSLGGDATYLSQTGKYTKVGNLVQVWCDLRPDVIGTGRTNTITGLPFVCADVGSSLSVSYWDFAVNNAIVFTANIQTTSLIVAAKATASGNYVGVVPFGNSGTRVRISGVYRTT